MALTPETVADAMYEMVKEYQGKKKFKAGDLTKAMIEKFGDAECDKKLCKSAIRILMDSGRCVYTYFGGSFIEMPRQEDAAGGGGGS
jgi:ATP-dependent protease HslVU (ClpYQ) peptidase subunit